MENNTFAVLPKILIALGALLMALGIILWLFKGKIGFGWFGNLPGDIKVEGENFRFYAPIVSMLIVSLVLSVLFRMFRQLF
jgi:ribose/xylose/arabinose/galactoside ABC-type transport system permease subunit